jgi:hypothetical protein
MLRFLRLFDMLVLFFCSVYYYYYYYFPLYSFIIFKYSSGERSRDREESKESKESVVVWRFGPVLEYQFWNMFYGVLVGANQA